MKPPPDFAVTIDPHCTPSMETVCGARTLMAVRVEPDHWRWREFRTGARIARWLTPFTHGTEDEMLEATIEFLDRTGGIG